MNSGKMIFEKFGGISKGPAIPPHITFAELLNLRSDRVAGGLTNRSGISIFPNDTFDLGPNFICAGDAVFQGTLHRRIFVFSNGIYYDDGDHVLKDATSRVLDLTIDTVVSTTKFILSDSIDSPVGLIVVRDVESTPSGEYLVVTAYNALTKEITVNRAPKAEWQVNDELVFYRSDILGDQTFSILTDAYPSLDVIDNLNNRIVTGIKIVSTNQTPWVGYISNRKYFGNEFTYNGLYVTSLAEKFDRGAFRSNVHHIRTAVLDTSPTTSLRYTSSPSVLLLNESSAWVDNDGGTVDIAKLSDGNTATYFTAGTPAAIHNKSFIVQLSRPTFAYTLKDNGYADFTIIGELYNRDRVFDGTGINTVEFDAQVGFYDTVDGTFTSVYSERKYFEYYHAADGDLTWKAGTVNFSVPQTYIKTLGDATKVLAVKIIGFNPGADPEYRMRINNISAVFNYEKSVIDTIVNTVATSGATEDTIYALNMSIILDGVNETPLLYTEPYGTEHSSLLTYQDATLIKGVNGKYIRLEVSTPYATQINRRITAIRIWGGKQVAGVWIWRLCSTVDINADWTTDATGARDKKKIILHVGNEINTGALYEDRNNRFSGATLIQTVSSFVRANNRSYVVSDENKQNIYYSAIGVNGYETSIIDNAAYTLDNECSGDIIRMSVIGRKLVVFKRNSFGSVDIDALSSGGRINVISRNRGLSSVYGLVNTGDYLAFATQTDLRVTDGFKTDSVNGEWSEEYAKYSQTLKETCRAWFDTFSDSVYFQFYTQSDKSTYRLWALHIPTGAWRQEDFRIPSGVYAPDDTRPAHASMTGSCYFVYAFQNLLTSRMILVEDSLNFDPVRCRIYEFPRANGLETNRAIVSAVATEINTYCYFKSNPVESDESIGTAVFIDGGFVKATLKNTGISDDYLGAPATDTFNLNIYDGSSRIKRIPITFGRLESTVHVRKPLSRWAISSSFFVSALFTIQQIGTLIKTTGKSGSVKQVLS
jgi:hypothetical protein